MSIELTSRPPALQLHQEVCSLPNNTGLYIYFVKCEATTVPAVHNLRKDNRGSEKANSFRSW